MGNLFKQVVFGAAVVCGLCVAAGAGRARPLRHEPTQRRCADCQSARKRAGDSSRRLRAQLTPTILRWSLVQAAPASARPPQPAAPARLATETDASAAENGGVGVREFQGDDVGQVLRLLARQAKINMVVSEAVAGTVTMRLEDVTALQAIAIIVKAKVALHG